jgi:hypothetical protein
MIDQHAVLLPGRQPRQRAVAVALDQRQVGLAARRVVPPQVRRGPGQLRAVVQAEERQPDLVEVVPVDRVGRRQERPGLGHGQEAALIEGGGVEGGVADRSFERHRLAEAGTSAM